MTKAETIERAACLAAVLVEANLSRDMIMPSPLTIADHVADLIKIADGLKARAERECNEPMDERQLAQKDRKDERAYKQAAKIAAIYDGEIIRMGDVRGFAIKIKLPTGRSNSMGGEGWGV